MKPWKVISFYTDDPVYSEHVGRLRDSLFRFNIPFEIQKKPPFASWLDAVNYKPQFVKKHLERCRGWNMVFLDADAVVQDYPALFDEIDCDIAVHYRKHSYGEEMLGGTVYVGNTDGGRDIVNRWVSLTKESPQLNDQGALAQILKNTEHSVYRLPAPYTLIFDSMKHLGPPVIEHFQASRKGRTMKRV